MTRERGFASPKPALEALTPWVATSFDMARTARAKGSHGPFRDVFEAATM